MKEKKELYNRLREAQKITWGKKQEINPLNFRQLLDFIHSSAQEKKVTVNDKTEEITFFIKKFIFEGTMHTPTHANSLSLSILLTLSFLTKLILHTCRLQPQSHSLTLM